MSVIAPNLESSTGGALSFKIPGSDIDFEGLPSNNSELRSHTPASSVDSSPVLTSVPTPADSRAGFGFGIGASLKRTLCTMQEDQLPWGTDFFDWSEFIPPRSVDECLRRLNLNIPFYVANYAQIFYVVTLPLLLLYDPLCFALLCVSVTSVHSVHLWEKQKGECRSKTCSGGIPILYQYLVEAHLIVLVVLFFFFDGLWTFCLVLLVNGAIILPHALIRQPTYFDSEELEKLRPKMLQYILSFVVLVLAYLECKGAGHLRISKHSIPGLRRGKK